MTASHLDHANGRDSMQHTVAASAPISTVSTDTVSGGTVATGTDDRPVVASLDDWELPAVPSRLVRTVRRVLLDVGWGLIGVGALIALWQFGASKVGDLPPPLEVAGELRTQLSKPFLDNGPNDKGVGLLFASSLQRVFTGFGVACLVGIPLGLLMGASKPVWKAANPVIQLLRPVSPLAWYPIWLVIFKDAPKASVWVIFMTAVWPIVLNSAAGAASVPKDHRNVARVFRFGRVAYLRHILIPDALPQIVTGLRVSMGVAWMVIVAVEMLSGGVGIGFGVWEAYNGSNYAKVISLVLLVGVGGLVLDTLFMKLGKKVAIEEGHG